MFKQICKFLLLAQLSLLPSFAYAAGLDRVNRIMEKVSVALQAVAFITVVAVLFWVGYKVIVGGQTLREVAPILITGIIIGVVAKIASSLIG